MNKKIVLIAISILFASTIMGQSNKYFQKEKFGLALGATVSATGGFGGQIVGSYNNQFALRLGYESFKHNPDKPYQHTFSENTSDEATLDVYPDVKLGGLSLFVDYYLFKSLYITGGIVKTNFDTKFKISSNDNITIDNHDYTPEELGELNIGLTTPSNYAPYLGIGFGRNIKTKKGLTLNFEIGATFAKPYEVKVSGTKYFEGNNDNESIDNFNKTLKDISWAGILPTIKIGISYRIL